MNEAEFYTSIRPKLGPFKQSQIDGFEAVLKACEGAPLAHVAYMLGTCWHETNRTMEPVREAYWLSEDWRKTHLRYYPWYGRGYVQLTWETNYVKADAVCTQAGLIKQGELLADPDLAMRPDIAALVMRKGMDGGWFTGVSLGKVLPSTGPAMAQQFMDARTIINGHDKAAQIEDYAMTFQTGLEDAGW